MSDHKDADRRRMNVITAGMIAVAFASLLLLGRYGPRSEPKQPAAPGLQRAIAEKQDMERRRGRAAVPAIAASASGAPEAP